jgi:hypothetical protein
MAAANLEIGDGRVWSRRIDARVDAGDIGTLLIHELTHVVLADRFCCMQIPRWADEGIAVLVEPAGRFKGLSRGVAEARRANSLLPVVDLCTMTGIPQSKERGNLFYGQSALMVAYLTSLKPKPVFIKFVERVQLDGFAPALRAYYGIVNPDDIRLCWKTTDE